MYALHILASKFPPVRPSTLLSPFPTESFIVFLRSMNTKRLLPVLLYPVR